MKQCPTNVVFEKEFSTGPSSEMTTHLDACSTCRERWLMTTVMIDATKQLPDGIPLPEELREAEQKLVSAALATAIPRRRGVFLPVAVAAAATLLLAIPTLLFVMSGDAETSTKSDSPPNRDRGTVVAESGARFTHRSTATGQLRDETVDVVDGTVTLHVKPLAIDERFRVVTADAEVEVRGTVFSVTASEHNLVEVIVESGRVLVRPKSGHEVLLTAGGRWRRTERRQGTASKTDIEPGDTSGATEPDRHQPTRKAEKKRPRRLTHEKNEVTSASAEADEFFKRGWTLFRNGAYSDAAETFDEAVSKAGDSNNVEDLFFWRAVAHFKSGHESSAGQAFRDFLKRYPSASRREEMRAMYGWHLLGIGDIEAAEAEFKAVEESRVGPVRESAGKGLRKIRERSLDNQLRIEP